MNRCLRHMIALVLIPCMLAEPLPATEGSRVRSPSVSQALYNSQALSARARQIPRGFTTTVTALQFLMIATGLAQPSVMRRSEWEIVNAGIHLRDLFLAKADFVVSSLIGVTLAGIYVRRILKKHHDDYLYRSSPISASGEQTLHREIPTKGLLVWVGALVLFVLLFAALLSEDPPAILTFGLVAPNVSGRRLLAAA